MLWVFRAFLVAEHVLWVCLTIPKVALPIANVNNNKSSKGSDSTNLLVCGNNNFVFAVHVVATVGDLYIVHVCTCIDCIIMFHSGSPHIILVT